MAGFDGMALEWPVLLKTALTTFRGMGLEWSVLLKTALTGSHHFSWNGIPWAGRNDTLVMVEDKQMFFV